MKSVDGSSDAQSDPIDHLIISLRAYVAPAKERQRRRPSKSKRDEPSGKPKTEMQAITRPSDWVLVFDCETQTTPDQRLRFGIYQLRYKGQLYEWGAFYEPQVLKPEEIALLRKLLASETPNEDGSRTRILTRAQFVREVFYGSAYAIGAQIVGFNLPFDLSRLAIRHSSARREMRGGFSLVLSEAHPPVAVKHVSQRLSLMRFQGINLEHEKKLDARKGVVEDREQDRGFFVDVKTLAAALTSQSHTLESLSKHLSVDRQKQSTEAHGKPLTKEYVRYAITDVQATWECFDRLVRQLESLQLKDTAAHNVYSEASLGKAYLKTMNIKPWRTVQPDFPEALTGKILSAYFGGRSEVRIRRQLTQIVHCDFLSMYPTVCTLMGLWMFVRSTGVVHTIDTVAIRTLVDRPKEQLVEALRTKSGWSDMSVLAQVLPQRDLLPVRATYPNSETATIGLNYLSAQEPQWFTLPDVLAAKILSGKTPQILKAIRFTPKEKQEGLAPVVVAGKTIDPAVDDFYRELIIHRTSVRKDKSGGPKEKADRESQQQAIKILANSTSYGIFVELIVKEYAEPKSMKGYGSRDETFGVKSKKYEDPGRYFHPLLGTLITGAARLMLALAEYQVLDQGLDWAFCDTDSIAIANTNKLNADEFKRRALKVRDWFTDLNPYGEERSILQLEKVNFPVGRQDNLDALDPPYCWAVSAKRYVLYNREDGRPIIRKASGHGLGHLVDPYSDPPLERRDEIKRTGVPRWQQDIWLKIIEAAESEAPDQADFRDLPGFDGPAASRYAATSPDLLAWFKGYNAQKPAGEQVFPFGFLLSLQAKSRLQMAMDDPEAARQPPWNKRVPRPAAPYYPKTTDCVNEAFDRETGASIALSWLESIARSLARYHLHEESKFHGGEYDQRGVLQRRHVVAIGRRSIGKEADNIEENELIGTQVDPVQHPLMAEERDALLKFLAEMKKALGTSDRELTKEAGVSHHTLARLRSEETVPDRTIHRLLHTLEAICRRKSQKIAEADQALKLALHLREHLGSRNKLAALLGRSGPYIGRILSGQRPITAQLSTKIRLLSVQLKDS